MIDTALREWARQRLTATALAVVLLLQPWAMALAQSQTAAQASTPASTPQATGNLRGTMFAFSPPSVKIPWIRSSGAMC